MVKKVLKNSPGKLISNNGSEINPSKKASAMVMRGFRLSHDDAATFDQKVAASGMTTSEFFREAVIANKTVVREKVRVPAINREVLHLLLKQGNNLNQLARSLNEAKLAGAINSDLFKSVLSELGDINDKSKAILNFIKEA